MGKAQPVAAVRLQRERGRLALAQAHAVQPGLLADGQAAVGTVGGRQRRPAATPGLRIEHLLRVRSEEHTSELQSLMRISYAVLCLTKKNHLTNKRYRTLTTNR